MKTIEAVSVVMNPQKTAELRRKYIQDQPQVTYQVDKGLSAHFEHANANLATALGVVNETSKSRLTLKQCDVCTNPVKTLHSYNVGPFETRICGKCKKIAQGAGMLLKFVLSK